MKIKELGEARVYKIGDKYWVVWNDKEMTLKELRSEITKLIVEEMKNEKPK